MNEAEQLLTFSFVTLARQQMLANLSCATFFHPVDELIVDEKFCNSF